MLYPMRMNPCYKQTLWGGKRLRKEYHKLDAPEVTAKSWELACHPEGSSRVAEGPLAGKTLAELDRERFWDTACPGGEFPVLVKLIDAQKDLSIQVHPSDRTALAEMGEQGEVEMFSCRYFRAYRQDVNQRVELRCDGRSFQHVLCVKGSGIIRSEAVVYPFVRGDSYFMPAALGAYQIEGRRRMLLSRI